MHEEVEMRTQWVELKNQVAKQAVGKAQWMKGHIAHGVGRQLRYLAGSGHDWRWEQKKGPLQSRSIRCPRREGAERERERKCVRQPRRWT